MSEHLTAQESKAPEVFGKSHEEWLQHLTGENKDVPCSRYGQTAAECAPWAVAAMVAWDGAGGVFEDDPVDLAEHFMSKVVNDHDGVIELILEGREHVPMELLSQLEISHA